MKVEQASPTVPSADNGLGSSTVVDIQNLFVDYSTRAGTVRAVNGVSLTIGSGENVGLIGESGSGKSTVGRAIVRLVEPTAGAIFFHDRDITRLKHRQMLPLRSRLQMVFQDPFAALNPRMSVSQLVGEPLFLQGEPRSVREERVVAMLNMVMLNSMYLTRYPHELSGGQLQRVALARALVTRPEFIVLDEPTASLDASLRYEVVELLLELQRQLGVASLFISHDLDTVRHVASRVAVMYLGELVEVGSAEEIFEAPQHPYTRALLSAALPLDPLAKRDSFALRGEIPSPLKLPSGCFLCPRCPEAIATCRVVHPPLLPDEGAARRVRCFVINGDEKFRDT